MANWTQEAALEEINQLCKKLASISKTVPLSTAHTRWLLGATAFLSEVFGESSIFYLNFTQIQWTHHGPMVVHMREMFTPGAAELRYNLPAFQNACRQAQGILLAAQDALNKKGIEGVYEGKNTGPEASLILRVLSLAESKLRKTLREKPTKEREIQDAFETLLIAAEIPYSREADSIEYSSKTYIPDFSMPKADLATELKLCHSASREKEIIAEINDDILAYRTRYGNLVFLVYDCGFIRDVERFVASFESQGAVYVRVVKH